MKSLIHSLPAPLRIILHVALFCALHSSSHANGFTDPHVLFYGEVRQKGGAETVLLQRGTLQMTFVKKSDPTNRVTLGTELWPTGSGLTKPYSYSLRVPLAHLPEASRIGDFLSIGATPTDFKIEEILINGNPATLPDGSKEFYDLSFADRASKIRLDLLVEGNNLDSDEDGIPDWWEIFYGFDPYFNDSDNDDDGDGWSNLKEFKRGSDPLFDNRNPHLATGEIFVSELGEAGVYLHFLDSDTDVSEISVTISVDEDAGVELKFDGSVLTPGPQEFLLSDLHAGRLTVCHTDRVLSKFMLPLSWNDGGESTSGQLLVSVASPSGTNGNDASLWLDGMDLGGNGEPVSVWLDRSGNDRNASQPLPEHQPIVTGNSVNFGVTKNAHLFFQDSALPTSDQTVFVTSHGDASSEVSQALLSTNRGFLKYQSTTEAVSYPGAPCYQMDGLAVRGYQNSLGVSATSIFRREGTALKNIFGLSYDGENVSATQIEPVLPTLGGRRSAIPTGGLDPIDQSFSGQINEILVFPVALAEQKLRDVHDYLLSKWDDKIVWDLSTELKEITLATTSAVQGQIIRGGHGDDQLGGGGLDDILSGGPGADRLTGGEGADRFVFGGVDTGSDCVTDFNMETDIIDLSAHFWGQTGDAREFISVRLDADFTTDIPTLNSVLIVQVKEGVSQEIILENTVIDQARLVQLIGEGHILMGGLSIPTVVQIALGAGSSNGPLPESLDECFTIYLTRSGAGVDAELDVPLGVFETAFGGQFTVDGISTEEQSRFVVTLARGQTGRTLTICPVPDLTANGQRTVEFEVLPQYKFVVDGTPIQRTITDFSNVWIEALETRAVSDASGIGQPARVRIHRDGDFTESLSIDLDCGGNAEQGVHIQSVADSLVIPAGEASAEIEISALGEGLVGVGPKSAHLRLVPSERYQIGNPHETVLYAAGTLAEATGADFNLWLQSATNGTITNLAELAGASQGVINQYLKAYALGLDSIENLGKERVEINIVNDRPEISIKGARRAADINLTVEVSDNLSQWVDASDSFTEVSDSEGRKFRGKSFAVAGNDESLDAAGPDCQFYRVNIDLEPGQLTSSSIAAITDATRWGISGNASWNVDEIGGDLMSSGGTKGKVNRIIAEVSGPQSLDFEMSVAEGGPDDSFVFYIDGVEQAQTSGDPVRVQHELDAGEGSHLLMWVFKRDVGDARIHNNL